MCRKALGHHDSSNAIATYGNSLRGQITLDPSSPQTAYPSFLHAPRRHVYRVPTLHPSGQHKTKVDPSSSQRAPQFCCVVVGRLPNRFGVSVPDKPRYRKLEMSRGRSTSNLMSNGRGTRSVTVLVATTGRKTASVGRPPVSTGSRAFRHNHNAFRNDNRASSGRNRLRCASTGVIILRIASFIERFASK
jgi:hypothetical protein